MNTHEQLTAPFPAHDIEWRVQSSGEKKDGTIWAKVLAYVTARAIMDRLDLVFGPFGWQVQYVPGPAGGVVCRLGVWCEETKSFVVKEDGAENTDVEAIKGGISSALKRAAVTWGIGRYLYRLDEGWAVISDKGIYSAKTKDGKWFKWSPPDLPAWAVASDNTMTVLKPREVPPPAPPALVPVPAITEAQVKELAAMAKADAAIDARLSFALKHYEATTVKDLTADQAAIIIEKLKKPAPKPATK